MQLNATDDSRKLRVALGQYDTGWHDPAASLARAARVIERASAEGAQLVVLPETSTSGFTMEPSRYAEPLNGSSATTLARLAVAKKVHVLAGIATREVVQGREVFRNSALLFGPDGALLAQYRKQRLFAVGGEDRAYQPGNSPVIADISGVRIAPFICYDLRFPELFRAAAPSVDAMILIANWPAARQAHWDVLTQARAIENQCFFVAVNRIGSGGGADYDGGSAAWSPWGDRLCHARDTDAASDAICVVSIDSGEVTRVRTRWPFVQDCRAVRP